MSPLRVAVLGAGVVGLASAAVAIQHECCQDVEFTLVADRFSPDTTGDGSAGLLLPYLLGDVDPDILREWCEKSIRFFESIYSSPQASDCGISLVTLYQISTTQMDPPLYTDLLVDWREMTKRELSLFPSQYKFGFSITTYIVECKKFLPLLMKRFKNKGGHIIEKKVDNIEDLAKDFDLVINCPGVEAAHLVPDPLVKSIRGQVIYVKAPWIHHAVITDKYYIFPHSDKVVCGGTNQVDDWNLNVDPEDRQDIWRACTELVPSLKKAETISDWVGLRPGRSKPRLERETLRTEHGDLEGTISAAENFNAERAAAKLRKAMKGIGSDERAINEVLVSHSNSQRQEIKRKYRALYGRDLVEDIQSELGGNFEDLCVALLTPQIMFLAECLHDATQGLGTDEKCIIEILCTHPNREIEEMKACYFQRYNQELEEAICNDTSGHFRHLMRALVSAEREEEEVEVDYERAERDAQRLFDGGVGQFGSDDESFTRIMCSRSCSQLQATFGAYENIAGHSITAAIRAEFSGDARDTLLAIVYCMKNRCRFFAKQLKESLKGIGTDDAALVRILVSRSEIDLEDVKESYLQLFQKELVEDVAEDTSGDYRKALIRLLQP